MTRYLLDTNVLIWFLENNTRLPDDIRVDIEYMQYEYYVSALSLIEIDNLQKLGKIKLKYGLMDIVKQLQKSSVGIYFVEEKELEVLERLEMKTIDKKSHGDYVDRMIIATAIAYRHTCISSDKKFRRYRENGLSLIEVD